MITHDDMARRQPGDVGFIARRGRAWYWRALRSPFGRLPAPRPFRLPADQAARLVELRAGAAA